MEAPRRITMGLWAFSQTDFAGKTLAHPVLVIHGDDDQAVPYADSGAMSVKLVQNGTLHTYKARASRYPNDTCRSGQCRSSCLYKQLTPHITPSGGKRFPPGGWGCSA